MPQVVVRNDYSNKVEFIMHFVEIMQLSDKQLSMLINRLMSYEMERSND